MRFTGSILNKIFLLWTNELYQTFDFRFIRDWRDVSPWNSHKRMKPWKLKWNTVVPRSWRVINSIRCNDSLWVHCEVNSSPLSEIIIEAIKANIHDMPCHPLCALVLGKYWKSFEGGTQQLTIAWSCSALKSSDRRQERGRSLNRKWLPGQCRVICS